MQMAYSAASPELSRRDFYPSFFRTAMSDFAMNPPIIALCQKYNWDHVATIHESDPLFSTVSCFIYVRRHDNYFHDVKVIAALFQLSYWSATYFTALKGQGPGVQVRIINASASFMDENTFFQTAQMIINDSKKQTKY